MMERLNDAVVSEAFAKIGTFTLNLGFEDAVTGVLEVAVCESSNSALANESDRRMLESQKADVWHGSDAVPPEDEVDARVADT